MKSLVDKNSFSVIKRQFYEMLEDMNLKELIRTRRQAEIEIEDLAGSKKVRDFFFSSIDYYIDKKIQN